MASNSILIHANIYFLDDDGRERMTQAFINDRNGCLLYAKEMAKTQNVIRLCIIVGHYNRSRFNYANDYIWYRLGSNGEFEEYEKFIDKMQW